MHYLGKSRWIALETRKVLIHKEECLNLGIMLSIILKCLNLGVLKFLSYHRNQKILIMCLDKKRRKHWEVLIIFDLYRGGILTILLSYLYQVLKAIS